MAPFALFGAGFILLQYGAVGAVLGLAVMVLALVWKVVATRVASRYTDQNKTTQ